MSSSPASVSTTSSRPCSTEIANGRYRGASGLMARDPPSVAVDRGARYRLGLLVRQATGKSCRIDTECPEEPSRTTAGVSERGSQQRLLVEPPLAPGDR